MREISASELRALSLYDVGLNTEYILGAAQAPHSKYGVADLEDDFERETPGFTFKIIPLLSNAQNILGIYVHL